MDTIGAFTNPKTAQELVAALRNRPLPDRYTHKKIADAIGIHSQYVWMIGHGKVKPSERTRKQLVKLYECLPVYPGPRVKRPRKLTTGLKRERSSDSFLTTPHVEKLIDTINKLSDGVRGLQGEVGLVIGEIRRERNEKEKERKGGWVFEGKKAKGMEEEGRGSIKEVQ